MKTLLKIALCFAMCLMMCTAFSAHPGGTDSKGGHYNRSTGEYHYHHGESAHQHPGGVCPYDKSATPSKRATEPRIGITGSEAVAMQKIEKACLPGKE